MAYKGPKPSAQPRTLRSIAESMGTTPNGFVEETPINPNAGIPSSTPGATQNYEDSADSVKGAGAGSKAPDGPMPFKNVKRSR